MQDEQFIRQWNEVHEDLTRDLHRAFGQVGGRPQAREGACTVIDHAYGRSLHTGEQPSLSGTAKASLRGLAASVITFALWMGVMLIATPAPGLAAPLDAPAGESACLARLALA